MRADVPERTKRTPPQPRWTIPDLLDLEFALARPGRRTMSLALWEWLGRERAAAGACDFLEREGSGNPQESRLCRG
jgi:hypothetical protein